MVRKKQAKKAAAPKGEPSVYLKNVWVMGDVCLQYADNLIIRYQDGVFQLTFFQQQMPPLAGTPAEMKEQLLESGTIENNCIARLVVSQEKLGQMVEALKTAHDNHAKNSDESTKKSGQNGVK